MRPIDRAINGAVSGLITLCTWLHLTRLARRLRGMLGLDSD